MIENQTALIEAAITAPSGDNVQPWKFRWVEDVLEVYLDETRLGGLLEESKIANLLSVGAVLENIHLAALAQQTSANFQISPKVIYEKPIAYISFDPLGNQEEDYFQLAPQIEKRTVNRYPFKKTVLTTEILESLSQIGLSDLPAVQTIFCSEREQIRKTVQFCKDVDSVRFSNMRLHKEFRSNVRYGRKAIHCKDGLAIQTLGLNLLDQIGFILTHNWQVMQLLIRTVAIEKFMAYKSTKPIAPSPTLGSILVTNFENATIVEAGRIMQRIWLIAQRFGLGFQPICTLPYLQAAIAQGSKDFSPQQKQKLSECQKTFRSLWSLDAEQELVCLLYTSPSPRDKRQSRMPSSA